VFVDALRARYEPMAVRLLLVANHYRTEWEWHPDLPAEAEARLARWRGASARAEDRDLVDDVRRALDNDLDTPSALRVIDDGIASGVSVRSAAALLGVVC